VDKRLDGYQADQVGTNNQLGAEIMVKHLLALGHRRIGFIGTKGVSTIEDRLRGYELTLRRAGIAIPPEWVEATADVYGDYGRAGAMRMLSRPAGQRPTAVFGGNDPVAETVAQAARELGLEVPGDLSVVGFDDAAFHAEQTSWLTTYAQPTFLIGQQAVRLLMARLQKPARQTETNLLEGKLIERASTAPPRGQAR
jgi:DNA-binding LacI/PurR family transcriptional regulator